MARNVDQTPNVTAFLAILLAALLMSAVVTHVRAQTLPPNTAATPASPATPENTPAVTPRSEAEAQCRAIGNQEQRTQCLAAIQPGGASVGDTAPPPPAEIKRPPIDPNAAPAPKPN